MHESFMRAALAFAATRTISSASTPLSRRSRVASSPDSTPR